MPKKSSDKVEPKKPQRTVWNYKKNERLSDLVDRDIDDIALPEELVELDKLQKDFSACKIETASLSVKETKALFKKLKLEYNE